MSDSSSSNSNTWTPFSHSGGGISKQPYDEPSELPVLPYFPHVSNPNSVQTDSIAWQNNQDRVFQGEQVARFHSDMNIDPDTYILNNNRFRETHAQSDSSYQIPSIYQRQQQQQQPGIDYYNLQQYQQNPYCFQDAEIVSYSSDMSGIYQYPPPPNTPQENYPMYSSSASSSPIQQQRPPISPQLYNQPSIPIQQQQQQQQFTYYIRHSNTDSSQYMNPNIRSLSNFQRSNSLYNYNDPRINQQPPYDPLTAHFQRLSLSSSPNQQQHYSPIGSSPLVGSNSGNNSGGGGGHKNLYYSPQSPPLQPPSSPLPATSSNSSSIPMIPSPLIPDDYNRMTPIKGMMSDTILWIPKNQMNCRTLQMKLDSNPAMSVPLLLSNLSDSFVEIIMDPFGNYLFQKIIDYCDENQIFMILKNIQSQLVTASKDQHGSRSIQALIKKCHLLSQFELIKDNIKDNVYELSIDPHGNHVLQLCIEKFPEDMSLFIFDLVETHVIDISKTKFGCYVVQKCYEVGNQSRKDKIADIIIQSSPTIISEPYGNYALQYIIENGPIEYSHAVYELIKGKIAELSMQKYSSNVLEKLILTNDKDIQSSIVKEITVDQSTLTTVAEQRFGIYVVRRLLKSSLPEVLEVFQDKFDPVYNIMKNTPRDKKNLEALEKPVD